MFDRIQLRLGGGSALSLPTIAVAATASGRVARCWKYDQTDDKSLRPTAPVNYLKLLAKDANFRSYQQSASE